MGVWRHLVLLCSLAVGCGGPATEEAVQEAERPQVSPPAEDGSEELTAQWSRPEPGTARLVRDIFPPVQGPPWWGPYPESLVAFRGKLFFAANFEDGRRELWKSDGTEAGTVPLMRFSAPPPSTSFTSVTELTPLGSSQLFFVASDTIHGRELWVTHGTTRSTRLVKDIAPGAEDASLYALKAVGDTLLFFRYIPETPASPGRQELWRSDGTEDGTVRVKDFGPDTSLSFSQTLVGNTLFFVFSDPEHGTELWKTDGTEAGTALVRDIVPGPDSSYPFYLHAVGSHVYFAATDPAHGTELWRSDGTDTGTELVADLVPGPESSRPQLLASTGSCLYFSVTEPADRSLVLYKLKEGSEGIRIKRAATLPNPYSDDPDSYLYISNSTLAGGKLFLVLALYGFGPAPRDTQLWVSDGTEAGTMMLHHPLSRYDEFGSTLYALDGRVLFSGADDTTGLELWESDGTEGGTRLLQDIAPGPASSFPQSFTRVGSKVFFVANDSVHGNELWVLPLRR